MRYSGHPHNYDISNTMTSRVAFVDDQAYSREFKTGDHVRKTGLRDFVLTPYVGRVLYSDNDTGVISVQWPWGQEQNYPSELVIDKSIDYLPPHLLDQSYSTWESARWDNHPDRVELDNKWRKGLKKTASHISSIVDEYESLTLPVYKLACKAWYYQIPEMQALNVLSNRLATEFGFDTVRRTVSNVYNNGRRIALVWNKSSKKYSQTEEELESGILLCPGCNSSMNPDFRTSVIQCEVCGTNVRPDLVMP